MANGNGGTISAQIPPLIIAALLGALITGGGAWMIMSTNLARLDKSVEEHHQNRDIHSGFAEMTGKFVSRREYEATIASIDRSLEEIKQELRERRQ